MTLRNICRLTGKDLYVNRGAFGTWLCISLAGVLVNLSSGHPPGINLMAFLAGLLAVMLALIFLLIYAPFTLVHKERSRGVLSYLFSLPVHPAEYVYAKLATGLLLCLIQFVPIVLVMRNLTAVSGGSLFRLGGLMSILFGLCLLASIINIAVNLLCRSESLVLLCKGALGILIILLWILLPREWVLAVASLQAEFWQLMVIVILLIAGLAGGTAWLFSRKQNFTG